MNIEKHLNQAMMEAKEEIPPKLFRDKEFYANWLAQTYYFVRHSTSLLGHALPHLKDPQMKARFEKHIGEEERHELLAIKDLEKLGRDIHEFKESAMTQAFYQGQYYRITFEGGTSLLGYILYLEGLAVHIGRSAYEEIKDVHKSSLLFLKVHAEEDPHHLSHAIDAINSLPERDQEVILNNLNYTKEIYLQMMQFRHFAEKKKAA